MQRIRTKGDHFDKVLRGATALVRVSNKTPELGEAVIYCENVPPYELNIVIERVTILHFEDLNPFEIGKTKFKSNIWLRKALESFYEFDIHPRQPVRLIEFFLDNEEIKNDDESMVV